MKLFRRGCAPRPLQRVWTYRCSVEFGPLLNVQTWKSPKDTVGLFKAVFPVLLRDKRSPWLHITKQGLLSVKWPAGPLPNSGSKGGWVHTTCPGLWTRERNGKQAGRAKLHIGSSVAASTATPSDATTSSHDTRPPVQVDVVYLCTYLCIIPTFCGSECLYPKTCLSLLFCPPASVCSLPHFLDGWKGMMLVLSCHPLVHMLLLPYFAHKAPLSSPHPVGGPAPSVCSDTFHTVLTELNRRISFYFSQEYYVHLWNLISWSKLEHMILNMLPMHSWSSQGSAYL